MHKLIILLTALALFCQSCKQNNDIGSKPNIVFILADDMGYDSVEKLNPRCNIRTPHIDKLISQGMHFSDAHSGSAVCSPTRYGVLTGRYSWRTTLKRGIVVKFKPSLIKPDRLTVADMLKEQGYATAMIGKWHLGWNWEDKNGNPTSNPKIIDFGRPVSGGPVSHGFDSYYGDGTINWPPFVFVENDRLIEKVARRTDFCKNLPGFINDKDADYVGETWDIEEVLPKITKRTVEYINSRKGKKQPFFLYFPLTSPHSPIVPSKEFKGKSGKGDYVDFVMQTDDVIGQVMDALDRNGLSENTLVIFTADNGTSRIANFEQLREKGVFINETLRGSKADIWDGGHRVPFVARWPKVIKAGTASNHLTCLTDFMATAAEVSGYKLPDEAAVDSRSLMPVLNGETVEPYEIINHSIAGNFAIREGKWKLALCYGSGGWTSPKEPEAKEAGLPKLQLYNLEDDRMEKVNLHEQKEVVERLTKKLEKIVKDGRSTPGKPQPYFIPGEWNQLPFLISH